LRKRVGQLIVLSFNGTRVPAYVRTILRERRAAGVILFGANVTSPAQLRRLTRELQRAAGGSALVAVDQEGGPIRIVPWAAPARPQPESGSPAAATAAARDSARDLRRVGVNVALGPVADVATGPRSVMRGRAYPGSAAAVAAATGAAVRAYRAGKVGAAVKHFPGLGAAAANTDREAVTIGVAAGTLSARDLRPFVAALAAGAPLVMVGHARYPALDAANIASQSPAIVHGLLRRRLGFRGVTITDSLEARAVLLRSSVDTAALHSLEAGVDILLTTGPGSYPSVYRRLLAAARGEPAVRRRVDESAARVLGLKRALGLAASR